MNAKGEITGSWKDFTDQVDPKLFENNFEMKGLEYIEKFLNTQNTIPNASGVIFKNKLTLMWEGLTRAYASLAIGKFGQRS